MGRREQNRIAEIEETQDALRRSIEQSKQLTERAERLLERHRHEPEGRAEA
jgi:hypothetical protein